MARAAANKTYSTFVGGLISEANALTFPENATYDEDNNELSNKGDRFVRLGIDFESGYSLSDFSVSFATHVDGAHKTFEWTDVGNDGDINFLVAQIGATLYFWNLSANPVSGGEKSFTIDLNTFRVAGNVGTKRVQLDSGNGWLFVVGEDIKPFYVKYDEDTDTLTATEIGIKIRDTQGLDDGLEPDEEPTTLSDEHKYNLQNQGWNKPQPGGSDPIAAYQSSTGEYPPNSKQWWIAKDASDNFDPAELAKIYLGNTLAPRGHYILDPFNKDRSTVSGVSGLTTETSDTRPNAIAFFAGRAWYAHEGTIYYSQIIKDEVNVGRCYQSADPTAEELNEIVDTDGGTIPIPQSGTFKRLFVTGDSLLVMASNGVWEISGSIGSGFRPTDYNVNKVGTVGLLSPESVVDVDGIPIWWSERGIYTVERSQTTDRLVAVSLTEQTIQSYYEDTIPDLSKEYATGSYDPATKKIRWLWKSDGDTTAYKFNYNRVLNFDVNLGAFYPWSIGELASDSPYVVGSFITKSLDNPEQTVDVIDSNLDTVVDSSGNQVTASVAITSASKAQIKFLTVVPGASNVKYTISQVNNPNYMDFETADDTGIGVDAYMETGFLLEGDIMNWKQQPYVYVFFDTVADSSCFMQYKWDWASTGDSGKWSTKRQVYVSKPNRYVSYSRQKVRGKGKALQIRFENETGKGYKLLGWAGKYESTTNT